MSVSLKLTPMVQLGNRTYYGIRKSYNIDIALPWTAIRRQSLFYSHCEACKRPVFQTLNFKTLTGGVHTNLIHFQSNGVLCVFNLTN